MSDLYITEQGSSMHKEGESLVLKKDYKRFYEIELKNIESIQIFGNVHFSNQVIKELLERNIELSLYKLNGNLLGHLSPTHAKNVEIRYHQYDLSKDEDFKLGFAKEILREKLEGSVFTIIEGSRSREGLDLKNELDELREWKQKVESALDLPELMGLEGSFARKYYECYEKLFKEEGLFNGRSKRPPKDEVNSLLSLLYTLITNRFTSYIDGIGFDPYIGFLHSLEYGRASLACDMVEPIRSIFCDRLVLRFFNLKMFERDDFEINEEGGFFLKRDSSKKFYQLFGEELRKEKNFGILKGDFKDLVIYLSNWMKKCFAKKQVLSIRGESWTNS